MMIRPKKSSSFQKAAGHCREIELSSAKFFVMTLEPFQWSWWLKTDILWLGLENIGRYTTNCKSLAFMMPSAKWCSDSSLGAPAKTGVVSNVIFDRWVPRVACVISCLSLPLIVGFAGFFAQRRPGGTTGGPHEGTVGLEGWPYDWLPAFQVRHDRRGTGWGWIATEFFLSPCSGRC